MRSLVGAVILLCATSFSSAAQTDTDTSVQALAKISKDICASPDLYGYTRTASGGVDGQFSVPFFKKRLIDLGLGADVHAEAMDWQGIKQSDLTASLSDYRLCTQNVMKILVTAYATKPPAPPTHHRRHNAGQPVTSPAQNALPSPTQPPSVNCSIVGVTNSGTQVVTCNH